jgi:hypothetical protein
MFISTIILVYNREFFTAIFIDRSLEAETFDLTYVYLFFVSLNFVFMGILQNLYGAVSGMAKTKYVMFFGIMRLWILRIPMILIGKNFFGMDEQVVWHAMYLSNIIVNAVGLVILYRLLFVQNTPKDPKVKNIINNVVDSVRGRNVTSVYIHGDCLFDEVCVEPTVNLVFDTDKDQELINDIARRVDAVEVDQTDVNVFVKTNTGYHLMLNFDHEYQENSDSVSIYKK